MSNLITHIDPVDAGRVWYPLCGRDLTDRDNSNEMIAGHDCMKLSGYLAGHTHNRVFCEDCLIHKHWDVCVLNLTLKTI